MAPDETNPWGLTPREVEVMRAVVAHGGHKQAARALEVATQTVLSHVLAAKQRMGVTDRLRHLIRFDRWDQQANPSEP